MCHTFCADKRGCRWLRPLPCGGCALNLLCADLAVVLLFNVRARCSMRRAATRVLYVATAINPDCGVVLCIFLSLLVRCSPAA